MKNYPNQLYNFFLFLKDSFQNECDTGQFLQLDFPLDVSMQKCEDASSGNSRGRISVSGIGCVGSLGELEG